jgi:hypothetical protein
MNPYEILQIDDFSSQEEVEAAFHQRVAEFDGIEKLTKKQTDLYTLFMSLMTFYPIKTPKDV